MKRRQQTRRPVWTREQMDAADWSPEQIQAARDKWEGKITPVRQNDG